ncbi:adenylyl-sulfate kinase [Pontibacter sp. SGAir0037]|uniref:adenylyl-sulfate kinase n=1 Tax=Pontibacter sp. SGAir0037 TaxID=2571030 RepID=UPI0010CD5275|nr:adenylyl-sulfate kinase [Pontibacter sp. SGAir0037]QCR20969.1 adenylyl-sulfate kinase [Pontibacter sp. SGAir0037]
MGEEMHVVKQCYKIDRCGREARNGHKAACLWFTGLSGSGKSTLANLVEQELFRLGILTYVLDGDNVRQGLNKDLTFVERDRAENIRRISEVVGLMCDAGLVVLAAFISPFRKDRQMLRELIGENFLEIYVDAPLHVCEQRDVKGLYQKARKGEISNFTGISSPFEAPEFPDVHIRTDQHSIEESVKMIVDQILPKLKL